MARQAHHVLCALVAAVALASTASTAAAAPGDPDATFGTGGVALVPGTDRLSGQGAPLVQADGRIVAVSLLSSASDTIFLSRFTATGQPDTTFGSAAGTALTRGTNTGIQAPLKRAATALAPGDGVLVAGGSRSGGTITVGRFAKDGAVDRTFNGTGKLVVNLRGRRPMLPTAMIARPDGSVLVTVLGDVGGKYGFTVVRITPAGKLDTTWGAGKGWVQVLAGTKPAAAFDLAALGDGSLLLAGGVLDGSFANPTDTAIVKLAPNGTPAAGFGTGGIVTQDLSIAKGFDGALAIAALPTGSFFVTGPSGSQGMVARFSSTGRLEGAFDGDGVRYGGFAPAGSRFIPGDLALDGVGRVVVAGTVLNYGGVSTATRWGVTRFDASGTATGFTTAPQQCANRYAKGPSGLTISGNRILVAGSCNDRGTAAVMALIGRTFEPSLTAEADVSRAAAGYETIDLDELDPSELLRAAQTLQSAPFRYSPFRYSPFRYSPFRYSPFRYSPFRYSDVPLSDLPLNTGASWSDLLPAPLDQAPLQSVTLGQVLALVGSPGAPEALNDLSFDDFDWSRTPMADLSLAALLLHPVPVDAFPAPEGGWGADSGRTFLEIELDPDGRDLSGYYRDHLNLAGVDFSGRAVNGGTDVRAVLATIPVDAIDLSTTPLRDVDTSGFTDLGQLLQSLRDGTPKVSLGQLLLTLIALDDIPFELAPRRQLLDAADLRDTGLITYTVTATVSCPAGALEVTLPGDARYEPGSSNLAEPTGTGPLAFDLCKDQSAGERTATLTFRAEPGSSLGAADAVVRLLGTPLQQTVPVTVDDAPGASRPLDEGVLRTGHIGAPGEEDAFTIPAPPPGTQVTVTLSQLTADLDLAVTGPAIDDTATIEQSPFRYSPFRYSPFRYSPVPDPTGEPTDPSVVSPNAVQDAPFRYSPTDTRRGVSVKRGTADESVSFVSRASDAGGTFTVRVAGFDGATSKDAYVVRRIEADAPQRPGCIADRTALGDGPHGTQPAGIPAGTRTLVLVNEQRMRTLFPNGDVDEMLEQVRRRYLSRPEVSGVLLPVDGSRTVRDAYGAWDGDPCSVAKANDVVKAINDLVDTYRRDGGLPELRNVVVLGPDAAIPQLRVADESRLANETTFAGDMVFDGLDDPIARALREGHLLTDDAYGDFDPQSLGTRTLYIPDVALGRLVESPEQITAAVQAYDAANGQIEPDTGYVAGYDFLSDAAEAIFTGLQPLGFATSTKEVGRDWTSQTGSAGMNNPGGISSINAHFDTYRAMPAQAYFNNTPDLFEARDAQPGPQTLLFTIGCHSGLNVAAAGLAGVDANDPRLADWTERVTRSGALWVGQTGYGLGDSAAIAYSERLMSSFAGLLGREESSIGQSLMFAKQDYSATSLGLLDDYDIKTLQQATFYGLPTYTTPGARTADPPPVAGTPRAAREAGVQAAAADTLGDARTGGFRYSSAEHPFELDRSTDGRGAYWTVDGEEPLVISRRPIQPRWTIDVTAGDGLPVHGALVDELAMEETGGVDPVIARPTVDLSAHEPEPDVLDAPFPATLTSVSPLLEPDGRHDRLTLYAGQFRPAGTAQGTGTQRFYTVMAGRTLRSASDDYTPPQIRLTDAAFSAATVGFRVETMSGELGGGVGGVVLYRTRSGGNRWIAAQLSPAGGSTLRANGPLGSADDVVVEWTAQVADAAGNVGVSTNKVIGYQASPAPPPSSGPTVAFSGDTRGPAGAYEGSPSIRVDGTTSGVTYEYRVDDGPWTPYPGVAFEVPGLADGLHTVRFRGSDGRTAEGSFLVDTAAPALSAAATPAPGPGGWYTDDVTVAFVCTDAGAGVDPSACPSPVTITAEGSTGVTRSVTDRAGRSSGDVTFGPYRIDRTDPDAPIAADGAEYVELIGDDRLAGTATDVPSGVQEVVVTFEEHTDDERPAGRTVTRTSGCDGGSPCTWSVPRPPDGYWSASVAAKDRADRTGPAATIDVSSRERCFDCGDGGTFDHSGFTSLDGLQLNGTAEQVPDGIQLTPEAGGNGTIFRSRPVSTHNSFMTKARIRMAGGTSWDPADGMALVLHHDREVATAQGVGGGGMGYAGLTPSLAVEYDIYENELDPYDNHVAITEDGDHEGHFAVGNPPFDLYGGDRFTWIAYDAEAHRLDVWVSTTDSEEPSGEPLVSADVDLAGTIGGGTAFIGWTASTGALQARQSVRDWSFESTPANLVRNGSFERPDAPTGSFAIFPNGEVPGWNLLAGSNGTGIEIQDRLGTAAPGGGDQWVELDSDGTTRMYQDLATEPGQTYMLSFQTTPRPERPAEDGRFRVAIGPVAGKSPPDDSDILPFDGTAGGEDNDWQTHYHQFTAGSATTRLVFGDQDLGPSNSYGPLIDDVRVLPVGCGECG